jgi:hypothetical protein
LLIMQVFAIHPRPTISVCNHDHSFLQNRLSSWVLCLVALAGVITTAGCGGIVANKAVSASTGSFTVSPGSVSFGSVTVGTEATNTITLTNSTSDAIAISSLTVSGAFAVDGAGSLPASLAANGTLNLNVHFSPTAAGAASGQLVIANNSLTSPSVTVQLSGTGVAATSTLSVNATSVAFGDVTVGTPSTQSLTLSSTGSAAVTVSATSITGAGFAFSGATFPLTISSGQSATLSVQFDPTSAGAATGQMTITSNSSANPQVQVSLTGTGETAPPAASYQVNLGWTAPTSSSDPVSGYNIYRATGTSSTFQKLNSSVSAPVSYTDDSVQGSTSYQYYVTAVDSSGVESVPSNTATVTVP